MFKDKNGKVRRTYVLTEERFMSMEENGYIYKSISCMESCQEAYDRLSERYGVVKIYESTTAVRGYHKLYAMCKY